MILDERKREISRLWVLPKKKQQLDNTASWGVPFPAAPRNMPMNYSFTRHEPYPRPKKRPHPQDSDESEPVQKMFISEKFANDLAAMTLNHKDENATSNHSLQYPVYGPAVPPRKPRGSVVFIDDINDFLSDDESDEANSMDTDFLLPMQKRPGEQKFHIPDFVLQDPRSYVFFVYLFNQSQSRVGLTDFL